MEQRESELDWLRHVVDTASDEAPLIIVVSTISRMYICTCNISTCASFCFPSFFFLFSTVYRLHFARVIVSVIK